MRRESALCRGSNLGFRATKGQSSHEEVIVIPAAHLERLLPLERPHRCSLSCALLCAIMEGTLYQILHLERSASQAEVRNDSSSFCSRVCACRCCCQITMNYDYFCR